MAQQVLVSWNVYLLAHELKQVPIQQRNNHVETLLRTGKYSANILAAAMGYINKLSQSDIGELAENYRGYSLLS
jgi:hypothetical protein